MLYVTVNRLGRSGKTTLARYVLVPRLTGALMLSVESSTADGTEALLIKRTETKGAQTLTAALAGVAAGRQSHVLDVGSADTDAVLPALLAYAANHPVHVLIPVRAAGKAASAADQLVSETAGQPGVTVTLVANTLRTRRNSRGSVASPNWRELPPRRGPGHCRSAS